MQEESTTASNELMDSRKHLEMCERIDLLEAAKKALPIEYREDGPPLSFVFDDVPLRSCLSSHEGNTYVTDNDGRNKCKRIATGEYDAEAAEDGSIQEIRKRIPISKRCLKKNEGSQEEDNPFRLSRKTDKNFRFDKEAERQLKKKERKLNKEKERLNKEKMKEMEKQVKEREKHLKVQQREKEKQKQQLERHQKRQERELEKVRKAEERKKLQEDKKREKDLKKALADQRRVAQKEIEKQLDAGPPDDLDLEVEELLKAQNQDDEGDDVAIERPQFPPASLSLSLAFPEFTPQVVSDIFMTWSFLQSFSDIIGIQSFSIHKFIHSITLGQQSCFFSFIHIGLIRLIQADMEESHHLVLTQGSGGTSNFMDKAVVGISGTLDEALLWGFDVDAWRGHLNVLTWPEILRQLAIADGHGPKRLGENKERLVRTSNGTDDSQSEEPTPLYPGLKMPSRLTQGTVKAAAWHVLANIGPEGLTIAEIASRIQKQGLRDLTTSKTPEATVAGALSRDSVFARVAPATYALHAIVTSNCDLNVVNTLLQEDTSEMMEDVKFHEDLVTESWIHALTVGDYSSLSFEMRLEVLKTLCNMALDSPTLRACLEGRLNLEIAQQRKFDVEARAEKRARREQAAEETQKRLLEMDNAGILTPMQVDAVSENLDSIVKTIMNESLQQSVTCTPGSVSSRLRESLVSKAQNHVRFEPIGVDRRFNRYWRLYDGDLVETVENCIYIEIQGVFKVIKTQEGLDQLLETFDRRGAREGLLYTILRNFQLPSDLSELNSPMTVLSMQEDEETAPEVELFSQKYLRMEPSSDKDWLMRLKKGLRSIEKATVNIAKQDFDISIWQENLETADSVDEILKLMGQLEYSLVSETFHSTYKKQPVLLSGAWRQPHSSDIVNGVNVCLSWVPPSFAAAYLHLCSLDASLGYQSGMLCGRDMLMAYKYVQKPFINDLNQNGDTSTEDQETKNEHSLSQIVSMEPISDGGSLVESSIPIDQKKSSIQKRPIPFNFQTDQIREDVMAAERNGTLYARMQVGRGRASNRSNGSKNPNSTPTTKDSMDLDDDGSNDEVEASSEDQEARENTVYSDDDRSENSADGYDMSQDGDDDDYRL